MVKQFRPKELANPAERGTTALRQSGLAAAGEADARARPRDDYPSPPERREGVGVVTNQPFGFGERNST